MAAYGGMSGGRHTEGRSPEELIASIERTIDGMAASVGRERLNGAAQALGLDLFDLEREPRFALEAAQAYLATGQQLGPAEHVALSIAFLRSAQYQLAMASDPYEQECGEDEPPARSWTYYYGGRRFRTCNHSPSHTREE